MKSIKYTLAALAIIAAASVGTAKAQFDGGSPGNPGELVLGIYNTSTSLDVDLGAYNSLTNGEVFNLENIVSTNLTSGALTYNIAGTAFNSTAGGIPANGVVITGTSLVAPSGGTVSESGNIATVVNNFGSGTVVTPSDQVNNYYAETLPNSNSTSFYSQENNGSNGFQWGFGSGDSLQQSYTGTGTIGLFELNGTATPVKVGTFTFATTAGDTTLTFNTLSATPEPSAYALGLCALALFWVLKRRSSTVA